jgi:hypothetical protein
VILRAVFGGVSSGIRTRGAVTRLLLGVGAVACAPGDAPRQESTAEAVVLAAPDREESTNPNPQPTATFDGESTDSASKRPDAFAPWEPSLASSGRRAWRGSGTRRWSHVGSLNDTTILTPSTIVVTTNVVAVSDRGPKRLLGLDRDNGSIVWTAGREGSGPGEFREPVLFPDGPGSLLVVDYSLRRLSTWSSEGTRVTERSFGSFGLISGACRVSDSVFVVKVRPGGAHVLDGLGELRHGVDTLEHLRGLPLAVPPHRTGLGADAKVVRAEDGQCFVAPNRYAWIGIYGPSRSLDTLSLVERAAPPIVIEQATGPKSSQSYVSSETPLVTAGVAATATHTFVVTHGRTAQRLRIIDVYTRVPWTYEGSILAEGRIYAIAAADSTLAMIRADSSGYLRIDVSTIRVPPL